MCRYRYVLRAGGPLLLTVPSLMHQAPGALSIRNQARLSGGGYAISEVSGVIE